MPQTISENVTGVEIRVYKVSCWYSSVMRSMTSADAMMAGMKTSSGINRPYTNS
ncbi:MAG: hypothetical protein WC620_04510 [Methanoregula sp.]